MLQGEKSHARLIITPEFLESWKTLRLGNEQKSQSSYLAEVDVTISVEAGRTFLTPDEIASLHIGDFLMIDHPFFIPNSPKSRVFLTHNGHPFFRAKVQEGGIKILEMPLQHEAFLPLGGLSMSTKEDLSHQSVKGSRSLPDDDDPPSPMPKFPQDQAPAPEGYPEESPFEEEKEDAMPPMTEEEAQSTTGMAPGLAKEPLNINQLPLSVVVELTELTMSIDKLNSLQPGNLLDLEIRPENGVMLVVNGKIFGQGELILIGDNVGVRIKELGLKSKT